MDKILWEGKVMKKTNLICDKCGGDNFGEIVYYTIPIPPYYWKPEKKIKYKCVCCGQCYRIVGCDSWKVE